MARIVFDLDGTLIDSAPDIHGVANDVLAVMGGGEITLAQTRDFIGNGVDVFITRVRAALGLPEALQTAMAAAFRARYAGAVGLTRPYPGVIETLEALKAGGHRLGLCTNKPAEPCKAVLEHLDIARFFDVVVAGDSLEVSKPDPAPLLAALAGLGEGPVLFVGDSEVDGETAQRARVPFALFTEGYRKGPPETIPQDAGFDQFDALPGLLDQLIS